MKPVETSYFTYESWKRMILQNEAPGRTTKEVTAMLIDTRAIDFPLTRAIQSHVESRVRAALAPLSRRVLAVTARLEDVNAGRGGVDKRCRLVAAFRHHDPVVVEAIDTDLYAAVDAAAHRCRRAALRTLRRHLARQRKDPQRPGALVRL
jgi:ribosome-associated translation inhibitor RaiA